MTKICCLPKKDYQPIAFHPPALACDSHVHVFGPFAKYPLSDDRSYTPAEFSADEFKDRTEFFFSPGCLVPINRTRHPAL